MRALGREIRAIEQARGIEKEAERAREGPPHPLHVFSQTPVCTPEAMQEIREEQRDEADYIRRRIRGLYFSVEDLEARRALIQKTRQVESLRKAEAKREQRQAYENIGTARESKDGWALWICFGIFVFAIGLCLPSWLLPVFAVLYISWTMSLRSGRKKAYVQRVSEAERHADRVDETTAEILGESDTFSELEERTGADEEKKAWLRRA